MSWEKVEKDISKGPGGLFKWFLICVLLIGGTFTAISYLTRPASMAVDRIVQKQSFQYKEGMAQRGAILEANIIEIDMMLAQYPERREELMGQKRYLTAQLRAIQINE